MSEKHRIIVHLDMDHFFTAVEQREHPELKGTPVIVGADPKEGKGRGVVSTSSYEARKSGVHSGIPISRAWKLCPEATYTRPNFPLYIKVSNEIMQIAQKYTDKFEQWGLDEAFLDITNKTKTFDEAKNIAEQIKHEIRQKTNLTCSIGVGPNKLIAKIASDAQKPDGLTIVKENEAEQFLAPLPARKLLWIGHKTEERLKTIGITTVDQLAHTDPTRLTDAFGMMGTQMYLMAKGIDKSEVEAKNGVKSISHETTFEQDTSDPKKITKAIEELAEDVAIEAKKENLFFKTVTIKVRFQNFETHTTSKTMPFMTNQPQDLRKTAKGLLQRYLNPERKIRLIGVRVSTFISSEKQKTLA